MLTDRLDLEASLAHLELKALRENLAKLVLREQRDIEVFLVCRDHLAPP